MQDLSDLMREFIEYYFTQIHTSFPGVVTEYDAKTRRATIQPSLKRRAGNKEYIDFPLLIDVPVQYPGTKKYTIHFPLEKGDEVSVFFSERSLDEWKAAGQDGIEDKDPRRFDLCDAYCVPGLQPQEFIAVKEEGLNIVHKTKFNGDFISSVTMDDDKIHLKYKKKSEILMEDDKIQCTTDGNKVLITKKNIDIESPNPIGINGTSTLLGGDVLQTFLDDIIKAVTRNPVLIPPTPLPPGAPVPPVPPLINMHLKGVWTDIEAACKKAKAACAKALK